MDHTEQDPGASDPTGPDEEYAMPCAEALLASSLALMTGYVQGCCDEHREPMAQKIVEHLLSLSQHPLLSPDFKSLLWNLHTRWLQQSRRASASSASAYAPVDPAAARLWHKAPGAVQ